MTLLAHALLVLLALLLLAAAATDIRSRIIPNRLNAAIAVLAVAWWGAAGLSAHQIAVQLALAAAVLIVFAAAFAGGMMGGGDVKLLTALALWLPLGELAGLLVWMAIGGGVLTLAMLAWHRLHRRPGRPEIPYGVAIVGAALLILANDILTSPVA